MSNPSSIRMRRTARGSYIHDDTGVELITNYFEEDNLYGDKAGDKYYIVVGYGWRSDPIYSFKLARIGALAAIKEKQMSNPLTATEKQSLKDWGNIQHAISARYRSVDPVRSEFYHGRSVAAGKIAKQFNPIRHTSKGWYWGSQGPFSSRSKAVQVAQAAYAGGYKGSNPTSMHKEMKEDIKQSRKTGIYKHIFPAEGNYSIGNVGWGEASVLLNGKFVKGFDRIKEAEMWIHEQVTGKPFHSPERAHTLRFRGSIEEGDSTSLDGDTIMYHITPKKNMNRILKYGLVPKPVESSQALDFPMSRAVYLGTTPKQSASWAINEESGIRKFTEDMVMLAVKPEEGTTVFKDPETFGTIGAWITDSKISPDRIRVIGSVPAGPERKLTIKSVKFNPTLVMPIKSSKQMKHLYDAQSQLQKAGVTFDTGTQVKPMERHWELDWSLEGGRMRNITGNVSKPVTLDWDSLNIQSHEELLIGAGMQTKLATKKWSELDLWIQETLKDSLEKRSKRKAKMRNPKKPTRRKARSTGLGLLTVPLFIGALIWLQYKYGK